MKIEWSDFAQSELYKTIDYIDENFGAESRRKFINEVRHINTLLKTQPYIGQIEPLLEKAALPFRSIKVSDINRMVYYIGEKMIEVVDFWDMRRNPEFLAERVIKQK